MTPYYTPPLYQPLQPLGTHLGTSLASPLPADDPNLLSSVGSRVLGGLGFVANVLDTPGSWVRNALVGNNPFQGTFDFEDRLSGRDVLEDWGVLRRNRPGLDLGDAAGFGLEVLTDPFSWVSGGLTKAGRIASKAGLLDDAIRPLRTATGDLLQGSRELGMTKTLGGVADASDPAILERLTSAAKGADVTSMMDDPLRASLNFHLPLTSTPFASVNLPGALGRAQALDRAGDWLRWTPAGQLGAKLFSPSAGNIMGKEAQLQAGDLYRNTDAELAATRLQDARPAIDMLNFRKSLGDSVTDDEFSFLLKRAVELGDDLSPSAIPAELMGTAGADNLPAFMRQNQRYASIYNMLGPENQNTFGGIVRQMRDLIEAKYQAGENVAMDVPRMVDEFVNYFPRDMVDNTTRSRAKGLWGRLIPDAAKHRQFRHLPTGQVALDGMARDENFKGLVDAYRNIDKADRAAKSQALQNASDYVKYNYVYPEGLEQTLTDRLTGLKSAKGNPERLRQEFGDILGAAVNDTDTQVLDKAKKYTADLEERLNAPKGMVKWFASRSDDVWGKDVYRSPLDSFAKYRQQFTRDIESAKSLTDFVKKFAKTGDDVTDIDSVPMLDALKGTRFTSTSEDGFTYFKEKAIPHLYKEITKGPALEGAEGLSEMRQFLESAALPERIVSAIRKQHLKREAGTAAEEIGGAMKSYQNLWKAGVTSIYPAFHGRNLGSALFQNTVEGNLQNPSSIIDAAKAMRGQPVESLLEAPAIQRELAARGITNPTAEDATRILQEYAYAYNLTGSRSSADALDSASVFSDSVFSQIPGLNQTSWADVGRGVFNDIRGGSWNPLNSRGVGGRTETTFGLGKAGERVGAEVEGVARLQPFIDMLRQGFDPAEAAKRVKSSQIDYNARNFTDFENQYLKGLFPFYSFTSRSLPHTVGELARNPGGPLAQFIRFGETGRDDEKIMPDYVGSGLAIGIPGGRDGNDRYISGFGLMHEDPLNMLQIGGDPLDIIKRTGMELLSRTGPLVKTPIELATGKQLYAQGRDLRDADPGLGRAATNVIESLGGPQLDPNFLPKPIEALAGAVPYLGRTASTVRKAADPRKDIWTSGINTLTGVRITDVSPAAREAQTRNLVEDELRQESGGKVFEHVYVPKDVIEDLKTNNPEGYQRTQRLLKLLGQLGQNAKARRAQAEDN